MRKDLQSFSCGVWTLEARRIRADIIEVFKIIDRLSTVNFSCDLRVVTPTEPEDIH